jgi:hypothetical protein
MSDTVEIAVGPNIWALSVPDDKRVPLTRPQVAAPAGGPVELLRAALEHPIGLDAPLRRAVTPGDHVVVVVDESLPHVGELVGGILEHLASGGVTAESVTLLVAPPSGSQEWVNDLPDEFGDVHIEVHDPDTAAKVAFLTTTKAGRRVYLNRSLVEAEFVVVLSGRRFDPRFGYAGAEVAVFPTLSNAETQKEFVASDRDAVADRAEAATIAWHLGAPFFVQVIEGAGDTVAEVVAGLAGATEEGMRRQDAHWRTGVTGKADLVIVTAGGPATFDELTAALTVGRRVLSRDGRLALLTAVGPEIGDVKPWRAAAKGTHLYVASGWEDDAVEERLSATPLASAGELQRLVNAAERVIVIPDANKTIVEVS